MYVTNAILLHLNFLFVALHENKHENLVHEKFYFTY
jgi:hypothetical protein